ncbi:MAG: molybdate ABC transporter substrate-binding protein [Vulcanimicrobiaceae bacterium]
MFRKTVAIVAAVLAVASSGIAGRADGVTVYALVAANATQPFDAMIEAFRKTHRELTFKPNYTGTQILESQLENGAPCDVFLSADLAHIRRLRDEGLVEPYALISHLHEVIVVPIANPAHVRSLRDLANDRVKLIVGVPDVPIGIYTRTIFAKADRAYGDDFEKRALANVVSLEVNVKQVLQKVVLGEADAGIVYRTDVDRDAARSVRVVEIPPALNVPASNYIAVATHAQNRELAREFVRYALSPVGRAVFYRFGYDRK